MGAALDVRLDWERDPELDAALAKAIAEWQRAQEDQILAQAEEIRVRRASDGKLN